MAKRNSAMGAMSLGFMPMEPTEPPQGGYQDAATGHETCDALEDRGREHTPTRRTADSLSAYSAMHQNRTQIPANGRELLSERAPSLEDGIAFSEAIRADLEPS